MRRLVVLLTLALALSGCGINAIPTKEEAAKAAWAQVLNQYQRRADLIPNLVATVRGAADFERDTLEAVVKARADATSINIDAEGLSNPALLQQFEKAQGALSSALSRLLVTVERYPDLKATQNYANLQAQLEGAENRIAVARRDFIGAVQAYNTEIKTFPGRIWASLMYGSEEMASFTVADEAAIAAPPQVNFGN